MNYANLSIDKINTSDVLSSTDSSFVFSISKEVQRLHETSQKWRSEFIIRNAVLSNSKCPLPSSKFEQASREYLMYFEQLLFHSFDYEKKLIESEKKQLDIDDLGNTKRDKLNKKLLNLEKLEIDWQLIQIKRDARERVRELRVWSKVIQELIATKTFNPDNVESFQKEHWTQRWQNDIESGDLNPRHAVGFLQTMERNQIES